MRIPGRRHWTETISTYAVTPATGRDTGKVTRTLLDDEIPATVQPATNAEILQHGLSTDHPVYFARYAGHTLEVGDHIDWRSETHRVVAISEGLDIDVQVFMTLEPAAEATS